MSNINKEDEVILNVIQVIAGIIGVGLVVFALLVVVPKVDSTLDTVTDTAYDFAIEKAAKISKDLEEAKND